MKTEFNKRAGSTTTAQKVVYQSDVTPTTDGNYIHAADDVKTNLAALDSAIHTGGSGSVVTVTTAQTPDTGYLTTYIISQGGTEKGKINIPKDFLVKSAEMGTVTAADKASGGKFENDSDYSVGDKYIDFVINTVDTSETAQHVYINVSTLVDTYTAAQSATQVQLAISNANEISATIVAGSITATELATDAVVTAKIEDGAVTKAKLDSSVQTSLGKADTALQSSSIAEGATNGTIAVGGTDVAVHGLGSAAYTDSTAYATSTHVHGSITNDGKIGSTSGLAVVTGTDGAVTTANLTTAAPTTGSSAAIEFITSVSQGANGKITATKEAVATVVASTSGTGGSAGLMTAAQAEKLDGFNAASTYKTKQTAITTDPTASGTASEVVTSVLQNANGEITVTRANLPAAVKSNWNETDPTSAAYIQNKPLFDGTYDAENNKVATQSTVSTAIAGLDVTEYAQATVTTVTGGDTTVTIKGIKEVDGEIAAGTTAANDVSLVLDGEYNASDNKIATQATVANKANKVTVGTGTGEATAGNFFSISSTGDLQDSGYKPADFQAAGSYKTTQTAVSDPTASGNAIAFIDTISQNANGEVSVTKKTVDTDGSTLTVASNKLKVADGGIGATQLANGAVETSKLAVLTSFKLVDTANDGGAFQGQVYQITIDHGVLTVTPVAS